MKRITLCPLTLVLIASACRAKVDLVTLPTRDAVQLTIYNYRQTRQEQIAVLVGQYAN
ncbi:MAG: hypothetical protein ACYS29_17640 [Planctomycetota bacterium]|jgi:hypothetical protein